MNKIALALMAALILGQSVQIGAKKTAADYVNPLIGTALKGEGGTAPFVGVPHAMTNFLPQTRENKMGSMAYVYDDSTVMGFLASHQPTVWMGDYGYVSLMPQVSAQVAPLPEQRKLPFSHDQEKSTPYYYRVAADAGGGRKILGEIGAASRCGIIRFTFPSTGKRRVIVQGINLNPALSDWANDYGPRLQKLRGWIKVDAAHGEIVGYNPDRQSAQLGPDLPNFKGYFVIKFDHPFTAYGTWSGSEISPGRTEQQGTRMGAYAEFATQVVTVQVGTSFISLDQARANMQQELPGYDLGRLVSSTRRIWNEKLHKMRVGGATDDQLAVFYTAMYHAYLFPREFAEQGRYYSAFDDQVHQGAVSYNDYSLWDTYRALHPLMTLLEPKLSCNFITSLLHMYEQGGWMPMWPNPTYTNIMIGTHADAVIADAYAKGLRDYDVNLAYAAMRKDAMTPPEADTLRRYGDRDRWTAYEGRAGATYYHRMGYIPDDRTAESVSRTLEYCYDDWCVAQIARDLGRMQDSDSRMHWSQTYHTLYNRQEGFMLPRDSRGRWLVLDDNDRRGLTEGSKWTYLFAVQHDVPGMIAMMGGPEAFAAKLDQNFQGGHYRHDNEPGHHYIYLYDYCGQPWKTQELVRQNVTANYRNAPDGINGNDDCGQMSAWYLFSVMGFYPVTPGSNTFALGAPQFPKLQISLGGHTLTIEAKNWGPGNPYVGQLEIDGRKHHGHTLTYAQLMAARKLTFTMQATAAH